MKRLQKTELNSPTDKPQDDVYFPSRSEVLNKFDPYCDIKFTRSESFEIIHPSIVQNEMLRFTRQIHSS